MATDDETVFDEAARRTIDLGNAVATDYESDDIGEIAAGLLAGAVQFWLFAHQPCGDPSCTACADVSTADLRLNALLKEVRELAQESEYFHSPHDIDVGRA